MKYPNLSPCRSMLCGYLLWGCLLCGCLPGCGSDSDNAQNLLHRQQQAAGRSNTKTPEERLAIAQQRLRNGSIDEAEATAEKLLIAQPDNPQVILLAAGCQAARGNAIAAAEMVDGISSDDPEVLIKALRKATSWLTEAEYLDEAYLRLQRILELEGPSNRLLHQLTTTLNSQGRSIETKPYLRALARAGDATERELYAMNSFADAFVDPTIPPPSADGGLTMKWLAKAKSEHAVGKLHDAISITERLAAKYPNSTPVAAFQGRLLSELKNEEAFQQWASDLPDRIEQEPEYWRAIATWLQRNGQHDQAIRCFAEAVQLDDTDRFAYLGLAKSLAAHDEAAAAVSVTERYELLDESARIATELGRAIGTPEQLGRMADILDQLRRPWEAIAWQQVLLRTHGSTEADREDLKVRRETLAQANVPDNDRWATCGIDPQDWPLPDEKMIGLRARHDADRSLVDGDTIGPIRLPKLDDAIGIDFRYANGDQDNDDKTFFLHQMTGGGIGVIDYDLDGWPDLYLTQAGGEAFAATGSRPNQMRRNLTGQRFIDASESTGTGDLGYGQGVAVADINQDGFADLVVANIGPNVLYINNGDGSFQRTELPASTSADGKYAGDWTTTIACGDLDGDRLPEIVEVNYIDDATVFTSPCVDDDERCNPSRFAAAADRILWNSSDGSFAPRKSEFDASPSFGFAAIIANFDRQQGNDLFIANDVDRNHFWRSRPGNFGDNYSLAECAQVSGCATGPRGTHNGCMGIAVGDFDRNGWLDLHVTNFWNQPADLYMQSPDGLFANESLPYRLVDSTRRTVGWGTQAVDFDRDGWLDLAVLNGHLTDRSESGQPFRMVPQLFRGVAGRFVLDRDQSRDSYWSTVAHGRTIATLDWNRDGRLDLIVNHLLEPTAILENRTEGGNWVQLELVGTATERDGVGAIAQIHLGETVLTAAVTGGDGFLCSNEAVLDFGIGTLNTIDRIEINWPGGKTQSFADVRPNSRYLAIEGHAELDAR